MTITRQAEIVDYLCQQLSPQAIHLEPVYRGGRANKATPFEPEDAVDFLGHFLQAKSKAAAYNIPLLYAGSRLDSIHGPYCHIFRNVLNLVPGGVATACFKATTSDQAHQGGWVIGAANEELEQFTLYPERINNLRHSLLSSSSACHTCFNQLHCVGECPDRCLLGGSPFSKADSDQRGFRCQLQKTVTMATLLETAERLRSDITPEKRNSNDGYACGTPII
jgi:hypothetical protein